MNLAMSSNSFTIFICMLLPALHLAWGYKPDIQVFPSKVMRKGDNVTIRCSSPIYRGRFRLQTKENTSWFIDGNSDVHQQLFTVTMEYNYYCGLYNNGWSEPSDILTLKVIDPHKPNISGVQQDTKLLITCRAPDPPEECRVRRFYLYSGKERITDLSVMESSPQVTFTVSNLTAEYRCSYELEVKEEPGHLIESPKSHRVKPTKDEGEETTRSNNSDKAEGRKEEGGGGGGSDGIDLSVLIPVVATVCGILIISLVVILVVYFMRKKKRSPQKIKNGELPQSEQAETNAEATYCTVDENKMRANPNVEVDMEDANDANDDGITYARLNKVTLKQKNAQSDTPTDTSLYAEVKKSQPK